MTIKGKNIIDTELNAVMRKELGVTSGVKGAKTNFNAKGDAVILYNAVATAGSTTITCPSAVFSVEDIGKTIAIPYAGIDSGANSVAGSHISTIIGINSETSIEIADAIVTSVTDKKILTDGAMTINSTTLTSASANFSVHDVGKSIIVNGAGPYVSNRATNDPFLSAKIEGYISATQVTISKVAFRTVSAVTVTVDGATIIYGTDDTIALQNAIDSVTSSGDKLVLEVGKYLISDNLVPKNNLCIEGISRFSSVIYPIGNTDNLSAFEYSSSYVNPLTNVVMRDFGIDAIGVTKSTYSSTNKCIYIRSMKDSTFIGLDLRNSCGTAFGCDYLFNSYFNYNNIYRGGRQVVELGQSAGGSGMGAGTGLSEEEPSIIFGNTVTECGNNGIFHESQSSDIQSRGVRVIGNYVAYCGGAGIADKGNNGMLIEGNTVSFCKKGIQVGVGFVTGLYSSNGMIHNNKLISCGIKVAFASGHYSIKGNEFSNWSESFPYSVSDHWNYGAIQVDCPTAVGDRSISIEDNTIYKQNVRGIYIQNGTFKRVKIKNNDLIEIGRTGYTTYGISIQQNVDYLYIEGNTLLDTRTTKLMNVGVYFSAITVGRLIYRNNDIVGMLTSERDTSLATITSEIN